MSSATPAYMRGRGVTSGVSRFLLVLVLGVAPRNRGVLDVRFASDLLMDSCAQGRIPHWVGGSRRRGFLVAMREKQILRDLPRGLLQLLLPHGAPPRQWVQRHLAGSFRHTFLVLV